MRKRVPFSLVLHVDLERRYHGKDSAHGFRRGLCVHLVEDVDLHAAPHTAAMLGSVQIDAGVGPSLDEKLAAEIEVFVLPRGAQPRGVSCALVDDDGAILHVEGRLRTVLHAPALKRLAIEEGGEEAGFIRPLRCGPQERRGAGAGEKLASIHANISLMTVPPKSVNFSFRPLWRNQRRFWSRPSNCRIVA